MVQCYSGKNRFGSTSKITIPFARNGEVGVRKKIYINKITPDVDPSCSVWI